MHRVTTILSRTGIAAAGAAIALVATAPLGGPGADSAEARRPGSSRLDRCQADLTRSADAYAELDRALSRIERINNSRARGSRRARADVNRIIRTARDRALALLPPPAAHPDDRTAHPDDRDRPRRPAEPTVVEPTAMSPGEYATLLQAVKDASFSDSQVELIRIAAQHNFFTVDQVIGVVGAISFAQTQVEIAALMYPRVLDRRDWYRVYGALTFDSSKRSLKQRVEEHDRRTRPPRHGH